MRYLIGACALVLVLGISLSAQAEVQNVKVGGDIQVRGIARDEFDLSDKDTAAADDESWYDSTVRLQIDAELTDDVAAVIRLINERDWRVDTDAEDDIELDLGYITLDNMFGYPVKATLGRQEILIGEGFLVGDGFNGVAPAGNLTYEKSIRRAFDALRLTYSAEPYTVDFFTAKIDDDTTASATANDVDLHGININYDYLDIATFDLGYFIKNNNTGTNKDSETRAISLRGEGEIPTVPGLTVKGEYVIEDGDVGVSSTVDRDLDANAWYLGAEYALQDNPYQPYIGATYIFMSGEDDTSSSDTGDYEQFDSLYEDEAYGEIAELKGDSTTNLKAWKLAAGLKPTEALSLDIAYYIMEQDEAAATYDDDLGEELDVTLTYDYTEDVQFGLSAAWFDPGDYYKGANKANTNYDEKATQIVGSVKISF